jgi:dTDP-glucose 4,6-dehydratase
MGAPRITPAVPDTPRSLLVTGGAGFIGANFVHWWLRRHPLDVVIVLDALTYAGNESSLADIADNPRYHFIKGDIGDIETVVAAIEGARTDTIVHFAAETHVDRSIVAPDQFLVTNVIGTHTLLKAARAHWDSLVGEAKERFRFHHVSTDEVFGSLGETGKFTETSPYDPRSPYSASKAASDHLVFAYFHTYGLPVTLSNCSNNYGPRQFPEKLVPLMIMNMLEGKSLPVYGDGRNVRDWLFVEDHASAIWLIMREGTLGEKFNVGGESEWENIRLLRELMAAVARRTGRDARDFEKLITYVKDRPGHDRRYAIDCSKIKGELGWSPLLSFTEGLQKTVDWYIANPGWIERVRSGAYRQWIETNYASRG